MKDNLYELHAMWEMLCRGSIQNAVRIEFQRTIRAQKLEKLYLLDRERPQIGIYRMLFIEKQFLFGPLDVTELTELVRRMRRGLSDDEIRRRLLTDGAR